MMTDDEVRQDVEHELLWDPRVLVPDTIGVAVADGAVTLTGHVASYAEKLAAVRAAERVYGVKAVADDIEVRLLDRRDDSHIAEAIAHILEWNVNIPAGQVHARVQDGWVTLEGSVEYPHQRHEVERMARHVRGVRGVADSIVVRRPPASPEQVKTEITDALRRNAELDARSIGVDISGHTARLYGHVHSLDEVRSATAAAGAAPGVTAVENHLAVYP